MNAGTSAVPVDLSAVQRWMDGHGIGSGPITDATPIGGGTQNILIHFRRHGDAFVLRRGPEHLRPTSNGALRREMQTLGALAGSDVPHPLLIAGCEDEAVLGGSVFYLMAPVDGFNPTVEMPDLHAASAHVRYGMGLAAVDALARLGEVDYAAVGLGGLGRPEGFLERQVPRWLKELESYGQHAGYPGPELPGIEQIAGWLESNRPGEFRAGLMHGDYHLANLMYRRDGSEVAAIVDWEMCTVGDPLLDLGWLLATWPGTDGVEITSVAGAEALPDSATLIEHYRQSTSRDLSAVPWYAVMSCFKLGVLLEGTYARSCAGMAIREVGDRLHGLAIGLFTRANAWMSAS